MREISSPTRLGQIIRETRKAQGLTQEQLAGICGIGVRYLRELEQGKPSCHLGKAILVASMLGLQLFVGGDEPQ